jgi:hypothetical protein
MADINGKWLQSDSVKESSVEFTSGGWLEDADGNIIRREQNGGGGNERIIFGALPKSSIAPSGTDDLVNKNYVDSALFGLKDLKDPVRAATTASDGNFVILGNGAAAQTIDTSVTLADGDRVLLKNQTDPAENGIYTVAGIGVNAVYTRATDADNGAGPGSDVTHGMSCIVEDGTDNKQSIFSLTTKDPITLGSTPLTFVEIPNPADHFEAVKLRHVVGSSVPGNAYTNAALGLNAKYKAASIQVRIVSGPILDSGAGTPEYTVNASTQIEIAAGLVGVGKLEDGDIIEVMYGFKG